jgi:glucokinase
MPNSPQITADQAERPIFVGVDVGGTNIKIGIVDNQGRTISFVETATRQEAGADDAMRRASETLHQQLVDAGLQADDVAYIGLGTPGSMDIPTGMILEPPNMPAWRDFPIRDCLSKYAGRPVAFANDANAAAYGEYWIGGGRDYNSMLMLTLGTGVGGGIIIEGSSIDGEHSFGSECGHIVIDQRDDARLCVWGGGQGQLEAYASAPAVVRRATELLEEGAESSIRARIDSGEELTPRMLFEEAEKDDGFAAEVIAEAAKYLGVGIVNVVHTVDPGAVIIGGAMTFGGNEKKTGRDFLEHVKKEFRRRAYPVVADKTVIEFARLGSSAGYIGAAGIAREAYLKGNQTLKTNE